MAEMSLAVALSFNMVALWVIVVCCVLAAGVLAWSWLRSRSLARAADADRDRSGKGAVDRGALDDDLGESVARIDAWAKETLAEIDARQHRLERLIRDADERIRRLPEHSIPGRAVDDADVEGESEPIDDSEHRTIVSPSPKPQSGTAPRSSPQRATMAEVQRMAAEGLDAVRIARTLQLPVGEVELVLSLQKVRGGTGP